MYPIQQSLNNLHSKIKKNNIKFQEFAIVNLYFKFKVYKLNLLNLEKLIIIRLIDESFLNLGHTGNSVQTFN